MPSNNAPSPSLESIAETAKHRNQTTDNKEQRTHQEHIWIKIRG